jgi:AI-2 transport protein TqsA
MDTKPTTESDVHVLTICQMIVAAVMLGAALYWLRPVLVPFVLALFLVCGIAPVLDLIQQRLGAPRIVAVAVAFLGGLALLACLWLFIWLSVASMLQDADTYRQRYQSIVQRAASVLTFDKDTTEDVEADLGAANDQGPPPSPDLAEFTGGYVKAGFHHVAAALSDFLGSATMVLIFMFFLLLGGSSKAVAHSEIWSEIESKIRNYIVTKTVISIVTGAAFGFVLWLYGIPLAIVFALLAFLLNFIPNIGPVIASLLPLPLIVLSPDLSIASMVIVIILTVGIQVVSGNVVEPKIMGDSFELHPIAVLLTLMLWGMIWGIIGMILATPVTAAIKILLERFDRTRPIAEVLAGDFGRIREVLADK